MKRKLRKFKDIHLELLKDPEDAKEYLMVALESFKKDGGKQAFLLAANDVAEARLIERKILITEDGCQPSLT